MAFLQVAADCLIVDHLIQAHRKYHYPKHTIDCLRLEPECEIHLQILILQLYVLSLILFAALQHHLYDRDHTGLYCSFSRHLPNYIQPRTDQEQRYESLHS